MKHHKYALKKDKKQWDLVYNTSNVGCGSKQGEKEDKMNVNNHDVRCGSKSGDVY